MASVYSGAGEGRYGTVQVKGSVEFGMQYNYKQGALEIHVKQCKELAAVDTKRNRSDPYVKVSESHLKGVNLPITNHWQSTGLSPAGQDKERKAKDQSKEAHAESRLRWGLTVLHVAEQSWVTNTLADRLAFRYVCKFLVVESALWIPLTLRSFQGRNDFLGEVMISLQNKVFDNPQPQWYALEERVSSFNRLRRLYIQWFMTSRANLSKTSQPTAATSSSDWSSFPVPTRLAHLTRTDWVSESSA